MLRTYETYTKRRRNLSEGVGLGNNVPLRLLLIAIIIDSLETTSTNEQSITSTRT